jgi:uncharacterized membrane protein
MLQKPSVWAFFVLAVAIRIGTLIWSAVRLPAQVATHFGASGAADGWGTRGSYLAFSIGISALVVLGIPAIGLAATRGSGTSLSIPHKDYWLRPENLGELRRRLTADLLFFGAVTALLMAWIDILVVRANETAVPTLGNASWVALGVYLVVVLGWTVWMMTKRYAVPAR